MALSDDQLKAMEASAPLLVAEYRKAVDILKRLLDKDHSSQWDGRGGPNPELEALDYLYGAPVKRFHDGGFSWSRLGYK